MPELSNPTPTGRRPRIGSENWPEREHRPGGRAAELLAPDGLQPHLWRVADDRADAGAEPTGAGGFAAAGGGARTRGIRWRGVGGGGDEGSPAEAAA